MKKKKEQTFVGACLKVRGSWGALRPTTKVKGSQKGKDSRDSCRKFKTRDYSANHG